MRKQRIAQPPTSEVADPLQVHRRASASNFSATGDLEVGFIARRDAKHPRCDAFHNLFAFYTVCVETITDNH